jgi:uncharacterized protein
MKRGSQLIYHGYLTHGALVGEPDLLERVEEPSNLGEFSYAPVDIKSGSAFEGRSQNPKTGYVMQLCAYAELLEVHQGVRPLNGKIIDLDGEWQTLNLAEAWPEYIHLKTQIDDILSGTTSTRPGLLSDCAFCPWREECLEALVKADDLTTVAGVGPAARERLEANGIGNVQDLAQAQPGVLVAIKGVGKSKATAWPRQALVQQGGSPLLLKKWKPPTVDFEVSYDIEDFTPDPFVYLHGLLIRPATAAGFGNAGFTDGDWGSFDPVFAEPDETESELWNRFLQKLSELDEMGEYAVYVFSHHERTALLRLEAEYGGSPALGSFIDRFVDLLPLVKSSVVLPTRGYGLKPVAQLVGFEWRDEDPGGAQSMAWWARYLEDPTANARLRERILRYNEDDVRASFAVRDWLEEISAK